MLQINRSGYNAWKLRGISKRKREEQVLLCAIITLHQQYPAMGLDGIYHTLKKQMRCSRNRIHRLMKKYNIHSIRKNAYKSTTNSNHHYPICENLLKRDFFADIPNSKWVGDITYIRTDEGWLYLATVKDLCTKKIVGYAFSERIDANLVVAALSMAYNREARRRTDFSQRQGCSVRVQQIPRSACRVRHNAKYVTQRRPIRQRCRREFLQLSQKRACTPQALQDPRRSSGGYFRLHRNILQYYPSPFGYRLDVTERIRGTPSQRLCRESRLTMSEKV